MSIRHRTRTFLLMRLHEAVAKAHRSSEELAVSSEIVRQHHRHFLSIILFDTNLNNDRTILFLADQPLNRIKTK
jgi:hypothetical protein